MYTYIVQVMLGAKNSARTQNLSAPNALNISQIQ